MERELTSMRDLGFNIVRLHTLCPEYLGEGKWDDGKARSWRAVCEKVGIGMVVIPANPYHIPEKLLKERGIDPATYGASDFTEREHRDLIRTTQGALVSALKDSPQMLA